MKKDRKRFYLKQVNIVCKAIEDGVRCGQQTLIQQQEIIRQQAEMLAGKLREQFVVNLMESADVNLMECADPGSMERTEVEDGIEHATDAGILWLTDCPDIAGFLMARQQPVMVWLHEGNRHCSFADIRYAVEAPGELEADFYDKIYRRYAGIPWEIAQTKRCVIRETAVDDVDSFVKIYQDSEITRYTDAFCIEPQKEREHVKEYIEKVYEFFGFGIWTVLWKETGEVIGRVGFEQPYAGEAGKAAGGESDEGDDEKLLALGYMIACPWQGKGIAQEICKAVLDFAREELEVSKVQVVIDAKNQSSLRLAERLGFGEWQDVVAKSGKCRRGVLELI
ncbi:MAG: GNAT family N-acetyltransferase [Lachnospiraceae bacterium]|nr:GNAT family N-acetyltransferase [Lachnospiraceae bacterium]